MNLVWSHLNFLLLSIENSISKKMKINNKKYQLFIDVNTGK